MALQLNDATAIINRLVALAPATGDYTAACWYSPTVVSTAPSYLTAFTYTDLAYTQWAGVFSNASVSAGQTQLSLSDGGAPQGSANFTVAANAKHYVAYIRAGDIHTFLTDGGVIGSTLTEDFAGVTYAELLLGNDRFGSVPGALRLAEFREWTRALSHATLQQEAQSRRAVNTQDLWCDCPLESDLLDVSGHARHLSGAGNFTFVAVGWPINLYLTDEVVDYAPPTIQGTWDQATAVSVTTPRLCDPQKAGSGGSLIAVNETSGAATWRTALTRHVSRPLAAQTLSGTLDMARAVSQTVGGLGDAYTKLYAYITQGDTDLVRGVVVDIEESAGAGDTEWPAMASGSTGVDLTAPVAVGAVAVQDGDRLVVISGSISYAANVVALRMRRGARATALLPLDDQVVGSTTSGAQFIRLSGGLLFQAGLPQNLTPDSAIVATALPFSQTQTLVGFGIRLWFLMPDGDYVLSALACNTDRNVVMEIWRTSDGLREDDFGSRPHVWPVNTGDRIYLAMYLFDSPTPAAATISGQQGPLGTVEIGDLLILTDDQNLNLYDPTFHGFNPEAFLVPATGAVRRTSARFTTAELAASLASGRWAATTGLAGTFGEDQRLFIYEKAPALTELFRVDFPGGGIASLGSDLNATFYAALSPNINTTPPTVYTASGSTGAIGGTSWLLPDTRVGINFDGLSSMGVARDGSRLYYNVFLTNDSVHVYNLLTSSAEPTFPGPSVGGLAPQDVIVLSDGTVLAVFTKDLGSPTQTSALLHYAADGTVLLEKLYPGVFLHHIVHAANDDPGFAWVWVLLLPSQVADGSGSGKHRFAYTRLFDGFEEVVWESYVFLNRVGPFDPTGNCGPQRFGGEDSCPLTIMMNPTAPPPTPPATEGCPIDFAPGAGGLGACQVDFGVL